MAAEEKIKEDLESWKKDRLEERVTHLNALLGIYREYLYLDETEDISANGRSAQSGRLAKEQRDPISIAGKHRETALAHASPHGRETAVGVGATTTRPLSKRQTVAQSNPA